MALIKLKRTPAKRAADRGKEERMGAERRMIGRRMVERGRAKERVVG